MITKEEFNSWLDMDETKAYLEELGLYQDVQRRHYDGIQKEGDGKFMRNQGIVEGLRLAVKVAEALGQIIEEDSEGDTSAKESNE